ncbi:MAG TPA: aminotransferase class IV [Flavisolibacter sp.]|jgi:D-alanine transaminase/branched-chain amino acid aminotransferase|nr:aminotransferase class IV [Flavisolibacter sp.]
MERWVYFNGFVRESEARLSYTDLSVQRGYGVFDFLKVVHSTPYRLDDHLDRFYQSARGLHLSVPKERNELTAILQELIRKNGYQDGGLKMTLTGGPSPDGYGIGQPQLIVSCQDYMPVPPQHLKEGIRLMTYPYQRTLPELKTIDYLMAIWLQPLRLEKEADDILYYQGGLISECPRSNIFLITREDIIITPSDHILKGITRKAVLDKGISLFRVEERPVTLEEVRQAKEVFITSTTRMIVPVTQIDDARIGNGKPGPVTMQLRALLSQDENH